MKIELKYKPSDEVLAVFKEDDNEIKVIKGKISEIIIAEEDKILYFLKDIYEEYEEEVLVPFGEKDLLAKRIETLMRDK